MLATMNPSFIPLGGSIPALTPHAVSVSLPKWEDCVGYEEGDKRVVDKMETGYPRFFIHRSIQKLAALCIAKFGRQDESCILLSSPRVAIEGRDFLAARTPSIASRIVEFVICPAHIQEAPAESSKAGAGAGAASGEVGVDVIQLQILLFDKADFPSAKAFWQHTGDGISSRLADTALRFLGETPAGVQAPTSASNQSIEIPSKSFNNYTKNRHYAKRQTSIPVPAPAAPAAIAPTATSPGSPVTDETLTSDLTTYLEERYGRNLPLFNAPLAKQALKRRIVGGLLPSDEDFGKVEDVVRGGNPGAGSGAKAVSEDDVYLYPGGMSAIWHAHDIIRIARRATGEAEGKSVCFGFPYIDTLKVAEKWGAGGILFGLGDSTDIAGLSDLLASRKPDEPRLQALFCEFPSNPLLRTPDLASIRRLADQYGFVIVVDETIGNFINVEVLPFADIVVSSLTKIFSGESNVMGGSLLLNPNGPHYAALKSTLDTHFEDLYYPEDAVYMERNSRDYRGRIKRVNDNAYDVCEYLHTQSLESSTSTSSAGKAVKKVYYPRYMTPELYEQARRLPTLGKGGYGGLFSLTFTTKAASQAFYDTLACAKGPSLGTSFTLASPYTLLAHYYELDWAAGYGVEEGLVRISVGQEDWPTLKGWFEDAVRAAEAAAAV